MPEPKPQMPEQMFYPEKSPVEEYVEEIDRALTKWHAMPNVRIDPTDYPEVKSDVKKLQTLELKRFNRYRKNWAGVILNWLQMANDDYFEDRNLDKKLVKLTEKWVLAEKVTQAMIDEVEALAKDVLARLGKVDARSEAA